jgi:hypothetical protein
MGSSPTRVLDGRGPGSLATLGTRLMDRRDGRPDSLAVPAARQQRTERDRAHYMLRLPTQVHGKRDPRIDGWSDERRRAVSADILPRLCRHLEAACLQLERRFPALDPRRQLRVRAGDLLIANNWGMFNHALLVVSDARVAGNRVHAEIAHCVFAGCATADVVYPQDVGRLLTAADSGEVDRWNMFMLGRGRNHLQVIRHRHAGPETIAKVVEVALKWTTGDSALEYNIHLPSVLRPKSCTQCTANVGKAQRYMDLAEAAGKPDSQPKQMCSEMAVAAWVAALGLLARDEGRSVQQVLDENLPIHNARGCWPYHLVNLPKTVPGAWEAAGVVACTGVSGFA